MAIDTEEVRPSTGAPTNPPPYRDRRGRVNPGAGRAKAAAANAASPLPPNQGTFDDLAAFNNLPPASQAKAYGNMPKDQQRRVQRRADVAFRGRVRGRVYTEGVRYRYGEATRYRREGAALRQAQREQDRLAKEAAARAKESKRIDDYRKRLAERQARAQQRAEQQQQQRLARAGILASYGITNRLIDGFHNVQRRVAQLPRVGGLGGLVLLNLGLLLFLVPVTYDPNTQRQYTRAADMFEVLTGNAYLVAPTGTTQVPATDTPSPGVPGTSTNPQAPGSAPGGWNFTTDLPIPGFTPGTIQTPGTVQSPFAV